MPSTTPPTPSSSHSPPSPVRGTAPNARFSSSHQATAVMRRAPIWSPDPPPSAPAQTVPLFDSLHSFRGTLSLTTDRDGSSSVSTRSLLGTEISSSPYTGIQVSHASRGLLPAPPGRPPSPSSHIVQLRPEDVRRSRRNFSGRQLFMPSSRDVVLALPGGRVFSQRSSSMASRVRSLDTLEGSRTPYEQGRGAYPASPTTNNEPAEEREAAGSDFMSGIIISLADNAQTPEERRAQERAKKQRQVGRWINETLPSLLRPFLHLLRVSEGLRRVERSGTVVCCCGGDGARSMPVICVYFDRESYRLDATF